MNTADPEILAAGSLWVGRDDAIRERLHGPAFIAAEEHPGARHSGRWWITRVWRPGQMIDDYGSVSLRQTQYQVGAPASNSRRWKSIGTFSWPLLGGAFLDLRRWPHTNQRRK